MSNTTFNFLANMETKLLFFVVFLSFINFSISIIINESGPLVGLSSNDAIVNQESDLETYIVLLEKPEGTEFVESEDLRSWHESFLLAATFSSGHPRLVHSYRHVVCGFSAKLTAEEAKAMEMRDEIVFARPQRMVPLHTTHTPSFLGLHQNSGFWKQANYGKGVIIGLIDSGIAADHPSFSGEGMPPPPAKWKGRCELKGKLSCSNKLIGARNFATNSQDMSDTVRHGTHTAGTAAGSPVQGASYFGQGNGTATGIAPLAHLAMYKVSGRGSKAGESEILAAMDAAIEEGVDVLSLSLGYGTRPFYDDVIAMAAYAAIKKGIFVSCSAGNSGPSFSSLSNEAPWILTVGASTVDRAIRATVLLGDKSTVNGESLLQPKNFPSKLLPLVYPGANGNASAASCDYRSLKHINVKGKIVLCEGGFDTVSKGQEVKDNGGSAMIVANDESEGFVIEPEVHVLPASHVSYAAGSAIKSYINSKSSPRATILFKGTVTGLPEAPQVAYFSSRGPSLASPGILKPDIIGPGVRIYAAWPVSVDNTSKRMMMESGTSMSCPHLSGVAALLKSIHPQWSPAAVKSAIMTTANQENVGGQPITDDNFVSANVFEIGAGHVNPPSANDPGLVYDMEPDDYIPYLCGLGYSDRQVQAIVQKTVKCSSVGSIPEAQLNYPSFSIKLGSSPQTYTRTVTNLGPSESSYKLEIAAPKSVDVIVTPKEIKFTAATQKAQYSLTFGRRGTVKKGSFEQGYLKWVSDGYTVGSPIAVIFK